jgi:SAM-dependent methyltransferase
VNIRVYTARSKGELGKFECVVRSFPDAFRGSILDVGSRSGNLKQILSNRSSRYFSLDLSPPADVVSNLERGLPFVDSAFDTVVALDVLEHTDQIHFAARELLRVARRHAVIALPNAFDIKARVRLLRGRHVSGKYGLPVEAPGDRHRWFFGFDEARRFCAQTAASVGWTVCAEGALIGPKRHFVSTAVSHLPNLLAPSYLGLLQRP